MKLPAGTDGGTITNPQDEKFFDELTSFQGAVEIRTAAGTGFILFDHGRMVAAMFRTDGASSKGRDALSGMVGNTGDDGGTQTFHLRYYNDEEFARALDICEQAGLMITEEETFQPASSGSAGEPAHGPAQESSAARPELDLGKLKKILSLPGVIAVSAFFEGFPVQSIGDADFEKVAASAEDFMRAGVRIAEEMNAGPLEQMILETAGNKFIIAPCGDLFLCVFTTSDTQLGLIRVVLKSIQSETCP